MSKILLLIIVIFTISANIYSHQIENKELSLTQLQAREYRQEGLKFQNMANLEAAKTFYQKAIELDPTYTVAYNDLGIIYESMGNLEEAELCYLKAIATDPNYLSAYSNLALLYEHKRELEKALYYWNKRLELGDKDDPWTKMAEERVIDIKRVLDPENAIRNQKQLETVKLIDEVTRKKALLLENNIALSKDYLEKAKILYTQEKYFEALRQALNAQQLDPVNPEITELVNKIRVRVLSK